MLYWQCAIITLGARQFSCTPLKRHKSGLTGIGN